jgi:hypothetical protein
VNASFVVRIALGGAAGSVHVLTTPIAFAAPLADAAQTRAEAAANASAAASATARELQRALEAALPALIRGEAGVAVAVATGDPAIGLYGGAWEWRIRLTARTAIPGLTLSLLREGDAVNVTAANERGEGAAAAASAGAAFNVSAATCTSPTATRSITNDTWQRPTLSLTLAQDWRLCADAGGEDSMAMAGGGGAMGLATPSFTLSFGGGGEGLATPPLPVTAPLAEIIAALEALPTIGAGGVVVEEIERSGDWALGGAGGPGAGAAGAGGIALDSTLAATVLRRSFLIFFQPTGGAILHVGPRALLGARPTLDGIDNAGASGCTIAVTRVAAGAALPDEISVALVVESDADVLALTLAGGGAGAAALGGGGAGAARMRLGVLVAPAPAVVGFRLRDGGAAGRGVASGATSALFRAQPDEVVSLKDVVDLFVRPPPALSAPTSFAAGELPVSLTLSAAVGRLAVAHGFFGLPALNGSALGVDDGGVVATYAFPPALAPLDGAGGVAGALADGCAAPLVLSGRAEVVRTALATLTYAAPPGFAGFDAVILRVTRPVVPDSEATAAIAVDAGTSLSRGLARRLLFRVAVAGSGAADNATTAGVAAAM